MQESNHRIWQQGVLTVYEELQSSDSEGEMNENDDNEDDFDGYLDETEMEECWSQRATVMKTGVGGRSGRCACRPVWCLQPI